MEITFAWKEGEQDRSHTQLAEKLPFKYTINVGGDTTAEANETFNVVLADPIDPAGPSANVTALRVACASAFDTSPPGA